MERWQLSCRRLFLHLSIVAEASLRFQPLLKVRCRSTHALRCLSVDDALDELPSPPDVAPFEKSSLWRPWTTSWRISPSWWRESLTAAQWKWSLLSFVFLCEEKWAALCWIETLNHRADTSENHFQKLRLTLIFGIILSAALRVLLRRALVKRRVRKELTEL